MMQQPNQYANKQQNKTKTFNTPETYVGAPYNFIPFSNKIARPYNRVEDIPSPMELREDLCSGEIRIKLTVETPLCISNGAKDGKEVDFFKGVSGNYEIPGSSLRGLLRTNMQILGFGMLNPDADFQNRRMTFRIMALGTGKKQPNLSSGNRSLADAYKGIVTEDNVKSGYILCKGEDDYVLVPTEGNRYFTAKRERTAKTHENSRKFFIREHPEIKKALENQGLTFEFYKKCWYSEDGKELTNLSLEAFAGGKEGFMLSPGTMNRQNSIYVFPKPNETGEEIPLSREDIADYKEELKTKTNTLRGHKHNVLFWELPEIGEQKPVFYVSDKGQYSWGPSRYPRLFYRFTIGDCLPKSWKDARQNADEPVLDYSSSVFGFIHKTGNQRDKEKTLAYGSRIKVGSLSVQGNAKPVKPERMVLAEPKPSSFLDYLLDGQTYQDIDPQGKAALRGFKQYWLKEKAVPEQPDKEKVLTTLRPMPVGTVFEGSLRYKNLRPDELGLLLWCICLEQDCHQNMGLGKPYGFGRCKLEVTALLEDDLSKLYSPTGWMQSAESLQTEKRVQGYIDQYKKEIEAQKIVKSVDKAGLVQDFMCMKRVVRDGKDVRYMHLGDSMKGIVDEYPLTRERGPETVRKYQENLKTAAVQTSEPAADNWESKLKKLGNVNKDKRKK